VTIANEVDAENFNVLKGNGLAGSVLKGSGLKGNARRGNGPAVFLDDPRGRLAVGSWGDP
jgi:hypothetical protein